MRQPVPGEPNDDLSASEARRRIAMVVQRYGSDVTGGAEHLARAVAERLARLHDVTVLTTCARDHRTWANHYPLGTTVENGVRVRRFLNDQLRADDFDRWVADFYDRAPHSTEAEWDFVRRQGPVSSGLLEALTASASEFDVVFFYTYLYDPTIRGLPSVADRAVMVPTAHDEPAIHLALFRTVFESARGFVFLSRMERALVRRLFPAAVAPSVIAPLGLEVPKGEGRRFVDRFGLSDPYLLYVGRVEQGKGVDVLVNVARAAHRASGNRFRLVLLGAHGMELPSEEWLIAPGFVDEQTKHDAIAGCSALVSPSPHESLGISVLEAWAHGRPVIADRRSEVVLDHCQASHAGIWYETPIELAGSIEWVLNNPETAAALGRNGQRFVSLNYSWDHVVDQYEQVIQAVSNMKDS